MVKLQRTEQGFSQEKLAELAGVHRTYITDVERGARNVTLGTMGALADALAVSLASLIAPERPLSNARRPESLTEVLLIDPSRSDAEVAVTALKKARLANPIRVFSRGAEALDYLLSVPAPGRPRRYPAIILLGLSLPDMRGVDVLRVLKKDRRTKSIPVVVITDESSPRELAECRKEGAKNFVAKPLTFAGFHLSTITLALDWRLASAA